MNSHGRFPHAPSICYHIAWLPLWSFLLLLAACESPADPAPTSTAVSPAPTAIIPTPSPISPPPQRTTRSPAPLPPPPVVYLTDERAAVVGMQNPAFLAFEIAGWEVATVTFLAGQHGTDGRRRLLAAVSLTPTAARDDVQSSAWRGGVHEDFFVWDTMAAFLSDGEEGGAFVPAAVEEGTVTGKRPFVVQGRFRPSEGDDYMEASLIFDSESGQQVALQNAPTAGDSIGMDPHPGDEFQLYEWYLDEHGRRERQPGRSLFFDEAGQLHLAWRPLPGGEYFMAVAAANGAGETAVAFTDLTIDNSDLAVGYDAYLDPHLGFQFLYPAIWHPPTYRDGVLYSQGGEIRTQITIFPDLARGVTATTLKEEALRRFGPVDILFTDDVVVAEQRGQRVAYGYENEAGVARTGMFFTLVQGGIGILVDVDGPLASEAETVAAVEMLAASWMFAPVAFDAQSGQWLPRMLDQFLVAHPADFVYQEVGGWQRFSNGRHTFVALRTRPATLDADAVLSDLLRDAGADVADVADFAARPPYRFALGDGVWQRADFSYTAASGDEIWGFIIVQEMAGQEVVAWAEAPARDYNRLETAVFHVMIADLNIVE